MQTNHQVCIAVQRDVAGQWCGETGVGQHYVALRKHLLGGALQLLCLRVNEAAPVCARLVDRRGKGAASRLDEDVGLSGRQHHFISFSATLLCSGIFSGP